MVSKWLGFWTCHPASATRPSASVTVAVLSVLRDTENVRSAAMVSLCDDAVSSILKSHGTLVNFDFKISL